jgi:WD40 repeat protein
MNADEAQTMPAPTPVKHARRRWFRFSLRTLLIFVLLVGSGMGLWWKWGAWCVSCTIRLPSPISNHQKESWTGVGFTADSTAFYTVFEQFSRESGQVLFQSTGSEVSLYDSANGRLLWSEHDADTVAVSNPQQQSWSQLSPGGKWLVFGNWTSANIRLWHLTRQRALELPRELTQAIEQAREADRIAVQKAAKNTPPDRYGVVCVVSYGLPFGCLNASSLAFSNDDALAAMIADGKVYVFDPETAQSKGIFDTHAPSGHLIGFASDSRLLVIATGLYVSVWDWPTGTMISGQIDRTFSPNPQPSVDNGPGSPVAPFRPAFSSRVTVRPDGECNFSHVPLDEDRARRAKM